MFSVTCGDLAGKIGADAGNERSGNHGAGLKHEGRCRRRHAVGCNGAAVGRRIKEGELLVLAGSGLPARTGEVEPARPGVAPVPAVVEPCRDWKKTVLSWGASSSARRRCSALPTPGVATTGAATGWPLFCASMMGLPRSPGSAGRGPGRYSPWASRPAHRRSGGCWSNRVRSHHRPARASGARRSAIRRCRPVRRRRRWRASCGTGA